MNLFRKLTLSLLLGLFCLSYQAKAGVLVEPYLGYSLAGDGEYTSAVDYSYSGVTFGGRLGYQMLGVMAGLDYSMQDVSVDTEVNGVETGSGESGTKSQLGIFVGYNFPVMLRAWGTLFVAGEFEDADKDKLTSPSGYGLGLGFTGLPFLSLNLEYRSISYDEIEEASGVSTPLTTDATFSEVLLSVSAPFDF